MAPPQWAYQVEHYVNEPDEELVCSVCRSVFCEPVMCPCDRVFCRGCINKWLDSNRNCPICRKRVSQSSVKQIVPIVKNIILKLMLNCHNKTLGCTAQFSVESSESHIKECQYEFVQCKNKPCKDKLFRKDITEHETKDCPYRCVRCEKCRMKVPTPEPAEKHDCLRALLLRLRKKRNIIKRNKQRIMELKNEVKTLKQQAQQSSEQSASGRSRRFRHSSRSLFTSDSLSPDEIRINIREIDSTSSSFASDSDDSSENSIIIFTNSPFDHSDNADSDSFINFNDSQDSVEYPRNESMQDSTEYCHAECQTMDDLPSNYQQNNMLISRNGNSTLESSIASAEADVSLPDNAEGGAQLRRPVKRRPTTQKPAKRRFPPFSCSSSDIGEPMQHLSPPPSKRCWGLSSAENNEENSNSHMEAGPSSVAESSTGVSGRPSSKKLQLRYKAKPNDKGVARHKSNAGKNVSSTAAPSRNAVFERTLALLEQYNLESDPEWIPEYASHRGDTPSPTDSDSSLESEFIDECSSSELSDNDSNNEDGPNEDREAVGVPDYIKRMFDTSSDDDSDWNPITYLQNKYG